MKNMKRFLLVIMAFCVIWACKPARTHAAKNIANCSIKLSQYTFTYNGEPRKPAVYVKDNGVKLVKNVDFTVKYSINNTEIGAASVTVKGIGKYTGSYVETFIIRPRGTKLESVLCFDENEKTIHVRWEECYDADAYEIKYSTQSNFADSKTVRIIGRGERTYDIKNRTLGKRYYVRVRTINYADDLEVESLWSDYKSTYVVPPTFQTSLKSPAKGDIKVTWNRNIYADGIEIALYNNMSLTKFIEKHDVDPDLTSKVIHDKTSGKSYTVRMRAYVYDKNNVKIYSMWSDPDEVKVK